MPANLVIITDRHATADRPLLQIIDRALCAAPPSFAALWIRDKDLPIKERAKLGHQLATLARKHQANLWVSAASAVAPNESVALAIELQADLLQLPATGLATALLRDLIGDSMRLGRAVHNSLEMRRAVDEGMDQVVVSPVFAVPAKGQPLGAAGLAELIAQGPQLHTVALGGITPNNAGICWKKGANSLACIRAVLGADDPAEAVEGFVEARRVFETN